MAKIEIRDPGGEIRKVILHRGNNLIGRGKQATLRLEDPKVSELHAMLDVGPSGARIFDIGSKNGIFVNGDKVFSCELKDGDRIRVGRTELVFRSGPETVRRGVFLVPAWLGDTPWWALSAVLHLTIILLVGALVLVSGEEKSKERSVVLKRHYKPPPYDPTLKRDTVRRPNIIGTKKKKKHMIRRLKPDRVTPDIPKGLSFENMSNKNLEYKNMVDVFGTGGGAAGAYGSRIGKGCLVREGGGPGTERAVLGALWWLVRHQNPDGSWSSRFFKKQCGKYPGTEGMKCRNEDPAFAEDRGDAGNDIGVTALALLAFTGSGHTHQFGRRREFVAAVKRGVRYLKSVQITDPGHPRRGRFGSDTKKSSFIYEQALATMALGELLLLTGDTIGLGQNVSYAAEYLLRARNEGLGWRYGYRPGDNDTSVTGWVVLALKACKIAPITKPTRAEYKRAFRGALAWFDKATNPETGTTGYRAPYENRPHSTPCMTAVAILCRIFAGQRRSSPVIKKGVEYIMKRLPEWKPQRRKQAKAINFYYWYYGSYALFQYGGKPWRIWNQAMKRALLTSQRVGGCADGSWDPISQWGIKGGRVYSTALGAMTLEVYYRFVRASGSEF